MLQVGFSRPKPLPCRARVFRHPQVIEHQADVTGELSHFLGDASHAFGFDDSDGKTAEPCDVFRAVAGTYPAAVFIEIPVQDVMAAVFDDPVATGGGKHTLRVGLLGCPTSYAVGYLTGVVTGLLLRELSLHEKCLSHMGKVQIVIEFSGGPDLSDFNPAMVRG